MKKLTQFLEDLPTNTWDSVKKRKSNHTHQVVDTQTNTIISTHPALSFAHRKADRLDKEYGAVRYQVQPINPYHVKEDKKEMDEEQPYIDEDFKDVDASNKEEWHIALEKKYGKGSFHVTPYGWSDGSTSHMATHAKSRYHLGSWNDRTNKGTIHTGPGNNFSLKEGKNYHSVFHYNKESGKWGHEIDLDSKEEANTEMYGPRLRGEKMKSFVVPKHEANWHQRDPHEFVMSKLNKPIKEGHDINLPFKKQPIESRNNLLRKVYHAMKHDKQVGFCLGCHKEHPIEPDAQGIKCPSCGQNRLTGAAEIAMNVPPSRFAELGLKESDQIWSDPHYPRSGEKIHTEYPRKETGTFSHVDLPVKDTFKTHDALRSRLDRVHGLSNLSKRVLDGGASEDGLSYVHKNTGRTVGTWDGMKGILHENTLNEAKIPEWAKSLHPDLHPYVKRVTSRKHGGDDSESHAVFSDNRPVFTGMNQGSTGYYKRMAVKLLAKKDGVDPKLTEDALNYIHETTPPGMEAQAHSMKPEFKKRYGKRWQEVLYATLWKQHNAKNESIDASDHMAEDVGHIVPMIVSIGAGATAAGLAANTVYNHIRDAHLEKRNDYKDNLYTEKGLEANKKMKAQHFYNFRRLGVNKVKIGEHECDPRLDISKDTNSGTMSRQQKMYFTTESTMVAKEPGANSSSQPFTKKAAGKHNFDVFEDVARQLEEAAADIPVAQRAQHHETQMKSAAKSYNSGKSIQHLHIYHFHKQALQRIKSNGAS